MNKTVASKPLNNRKSVISIGIVSLLCVFAVLVVTAFSIMIYSQAADDAMLTDKAIKFTSNYYVAESVAEENLQQAHRAIEAYSSDSDKDSLMNSLDKLDIGYSLGDGEIRIYYTIEIDEYKNLEVEAIFSGESYSQISRTMWHTEPK